MKSLELLESFITTIRTNCRSSVSANQFSTSSDNIQKWSELLSAYKNDISSLKTPTEINSASDSVIELLNQHTSLKDAKIIKNLLDTRDTLSNEMISLINQSKGGKLKPIIKRAQKKALELITNNIFEEKTIVFSSIFTNLSSVEMLELFETIISYIELLENNDTNHHKFVTNFLAKSNSPTESFKFLCDEINKSSFSPVFEPSDDGKITYIHPTSGQPDSLLFVGKMVTTIDEKGYTKTLLKPHGRLSLVTLQQYTSFEKIQLITHRETGKYFLNEINDIFRSSTEEPSADKTSTQLIQEAIQLLKDKNQLKKPSINPLIVALAGTKITDPEFIDFDSNLRMIVEEDLDVKTFTLNPSMDFFNTKSNNRKKGIDAVLDAMGLNHPTDSTTIHAFNQYLVLTALGSNIFETVEDYRLKTLGDNYSISQDSTTNVSNFINNIYPTSYVSIPTNSSIDTVALSKIDIKSLEISFINALDLLATTNPLALKSFINADAPFNNFKFSMLLIYFSNKFPKEKISNILGAIPNIQHPVILLDKKDQAISEKDQAISEKDQALEAAKQALEEKNIKIAKKDYQIFQHDQTGFWQDVLNDFIDFSSLYSYIKLNNNDGLEPFLQKCVSYVFFKNKNTEDTKKITSIWSNYPDFLSQVIEFVHINHTSFDDKKFKEIINLLLTTNNPTDAKNELAIKFPKLPFTPK